MMAALREWLTGIVVVTLLLSAAQTLVPDGAVKRATSFTGGLILLLVVLQPVVKTDLARLKLDFFDYEAAVEQARMELESTSKKELASLIEHRTATYISDKAKAWGQSLDVSVKTEENEEGIPIPALVELEGTPLPELTQWMEQELGLGAERQVWNGGEN